MKHTRIYVGLALVTSLVVLAGPADAQVRATPSAGLTLPDESMTTRADATSLELNPAGLGFMQSAQLAAGVEQAGADHEGIESEGGALFLAGGTGRIGAGFSAQWLEHPQLGAQLADYRKYTVGLGLSTASNIGVGAALNIFGSSDSPRLDDLTSWDLGAMWRPSDHVGFSVRARDLNQPFLAGDEALPVRFGAGVALRFWDGRLVVDPAAELTSDGDLFRVRPRVLVEPIHGVRLFARTSFNFVSQTGQTSQTWDQLVAGLSLNTSYLGVESAAMVDPDDGDYLGQTYLGWAGLNVRRGLASPTRRWILVDLTGGIAEQPVSSLLGPSTHSFLSLVDKLDKIAGDASVEGVVFNVGASGLGYAQIWEIRRAMGRLREAGKTSVSILTNPTYRETYLASGADKVWLIPPEPYSPSGLSTTLTSYGDALANAGIKSEFLRIGRFKSAPETYTNSRPSKAAIDQTTDYLDAVFDRSAAAVAADRQKSVDQVKQMVDHVPVFPGEAVEQGFADQVVYLDSLRRHLHESFGGHVELERRYPRAQPADTRWGGNSEIAVVVVDGTIVRGQSGRTPLIDQMVVGSDSLTQIFEQLRHNSSVRAVVVRINSPGGSAVASDLIYREMRRLAKQKPVIASMGGVAASGGYYVAAGADEIFATPNTLTGSIGIFAGKFSVSKLADLVGIATTPIHRGQRSGPFDIFRPWTGQQRTSVAQSITYLYRLFVDQVARTRPLDPAQVDAVGRGHIWDGKQAQNNHLVDHIGGLAAAIRRAESLVEVDHRQLDYHLYPESLGLFELGSASVTAKVFRQALGAEAGPTNRLANINVNSALATLVRRVGKALLLPAVYADGEALMLLPFVVDAR